MHHYIWALKILRYNDLFINFFRFRQQARVFNKNNFTNKRNLEQNYSLWKFFVHYEIFSNYIISSESCQKKLNLPHLPKSFSCWTLPHSSNYRPQTTTTTTESSYDPDVLDVDRLEGEDKNREEDMDIFTFTFMLDVV